MNYKYEEKDLDLISWERVQEFINKIYENITKYIKENNLKIKYIVPIMRGGGVPAIMLSHMLNCVDMLPVQLKYGNGKVDEKINLNYVNNVNICENECVLVVEGNHVTGTTAKMVTNMIKEKFGSNIKIIYVSLTKDYSYKDIVCDAIFSTCGMFTNESKKLSEDECKKLNINYNLVSVYPWENVEEELKELNAE